MDRAQTPTKPSRHSPRLDLDRPLVPKPLSVQIWCRPACGLQSDPQNLRLGTVVASPCATLELAAFTDVTGRRNVPLQHWPGQAR